MAQGSDANPLGLSLGFIEGMALVSLRDRTIADGVVIRALDLELEGVAFPLDLDGGPAEFQRRATKLRTLVAEIDVAALARHLQVGLTRAHRPIRRLQLRPEEGAMAVEAELVLEDRHAPLSAALVVVPSDPREVRLVFLDVLEMGYFPISSLEIADHFLAALKALLEPLGERSAETLRRSGASSIALDVVAALLWAILPRSGWKVPQHEEVPQKRLELLPEGKIRLEAGDLSPIHGESGSSHIETAPKVMRALARDDAFSIAAHAIDHLGKGDHRAAFEAMRDKLDASGGPEIVLERLFSLGSSRPELHVDVADLADDLLKKDPSSVPALLAKARIAAYEGAGKTAFDLFERVARILKDSGRRRPAGLAYLGASRCAKKKTKDRARVMEEAIAVLPDDTEALAGLIEELPLLGRATAAVRAARRLAHLAETPEARARAHVAAGDLLRAQLQDPVQAKREYERALKIDPSDESALEGLARAVMDQGDPRRAATLFERLIARAEEKGRRERAAALSLVLGDLWRPLDPEAAIARYRRAKELAEGDIAPYARLAGAAFEAGRTEAALEAVEDALPLLSRTDRKHDPRDVLELRLRAGAILKQTPERADEAIAHFEAALEIDPVSASALSALAELYERRGRSDKKADVLDRYAAMLAQKGDLEAAAKQWSEEAKLVHSDPVRIKRVRDAVAAGLQTDRRNRALLDALVDVSELDGDPKVVIEAIDRRMAGDDPPEVRAPLLVRLGNALARAGRSAEAARAYEEALALEPKDVRAIEALTAIYRERHDEERLAQALERAARIASPGHERAHLNGDRARLLASTGRDQEAYEAVSAALEDDPSMVALLPLATQLALRLGLHARAKELAAERLRVHREDDPPLSIYLDLARAGEGGGDRDALIAALKEAMELAPEGSETRRQIAAKLARELNAGGRFKELADLFRRRASAPNTPPAERAERYLEAARLEMRLGQERQGEEDARLGLAILSESGSESEGDLVQSLLDVLEQLVRKSGDPRRLAEVLGKRARAAKQPRDKERLRLEQARILESAALDVLAIEALEEASDDLPGSVEIARALGVAAERADRIAVAATAYGRAARIAESLAVPGAPDEGGAELAVEMHGRAAQACTILGEIGYAVAHDRALLALCPPGSTSPFVLSAVERLEGQARQEGDHLLLIEVLSRKAATAPPSIAARFFLEKAGVEASMLHNDRAALDSLKRARAAAPEGSEILEAVDGRLIELLDRLQLHGEQAAVLVDQAERAKDPERQAELYLAASRLYEGPLNDRAMALSRAQAALRAWPNHEGARAHRLKLLREGGRREMLVDALSDEAALAADAQEAARLWVEAAQILVPEAEKAAVDLAERPNRLDLEHALDLVRRASTAAPGAPQPLRAAVLYTRLLNRSGEEQIALAHLIDREIPKEERIAAHLRRFELVREEGAMAAQELLRALAAVDEAGPDLVLDAVLANLPPRTIRLLDLSDGNLLDAILRAGIDLAEANQDWATQVRLLMRRVDISAEPGLRADLRVRAGEVWEWKLGDGAAAEREYRAALALLPDHAASRSALRSFYLTVDRFFDLAENLGVDALRSVYQEIRGTEPKGRVIAAAEALWPFLDASGEERAVVQLELGELYTSEQADPALAVHVLEEVIKSGPKAYQDRALDRLSVLFLEQERYDLYVDVLRRQAERMEKDKQRAQALSDLGDALEWKLGDGRAAEQEYRAALAIDAACESAQKRLAVLLASQDRFEELGRDLGAQMLAEELDRLLRQGDRERERAWKAAEALAAAVDEETRGTIWLRFAERIAGTPDERRGLERAGAEPGKSQAVALDRLIRLLEGGEDKSALAEALVRRIAVEPQDETKVELYYRLGSLYDSQARSAGGEMSAEHARQAERAFLAVLELDKGHVLARVSLETSFIDQGRLADAGRVLGLDTLKAIKSRAEADGESKLLQQTVEALAELAAGEERAGYLVQLIDFGGNAEELYKRALAAHPPYLPAREGLRALYEIDGRYKEIADVLGTEALGETLAQLKRVGDRAHQLPAALALAHALARQAGDPHVRADLQLEIAALHLGDQDTEAAEDALKRALELDPDLPGAREELRQLLVAQDRIEDLAAVDEALVSETGTIAAETGDLQLEARVMRVLADRRTGEARADTLVLFASLQVQRGETRSAETALKEALEAVPSHALARAELEAMYWIESRFTEIVAVLGPEAFLARADRMADDSPDRVMTAIRAVLDELAPLHQAQALEVSASIDRAPGVYEEIERRKADLFRARDIFDEISDAEGRERVRLALVWLYRSTDDVDGLIRALEDAARYARTSDLCADLDLERATLLLLSDRREAARGLVQPHFEDEAISAELRAHSARLLVDDLLIGSADAPLPLDDEHLRERALDFLTFGLGADHQSEGRYRWLDALASSREALGMEGEALAEPLERALGATQDRREQLDVRRRLREIYEQQGDWARAEAHVAVIAEADDRADIWVSLAELRLWLDDRQGAEAALERALVLEPGSRAAHEALLQMAEKAGARDTMIDRLEMWAEADREGRRKERAERLLQAAKLSAEEGRADRTGQLLERAVDLLERGDPATEALAREACAILEPLGQKDAIVAILSRVVGQGAKAELRVRLADMLTELGRKEEAETVIEQGIHRDTPHDDPLIERVLGDAVHLKDDAAARRLLGIADRLGAGRAARRLRIEGAERAERAGTLDAAQGAWTQIASEVGLADEGARARRSLLRLARMLGDPANLVTALVASAEDATSSIERASLLSEASHRAESELHDVDRAEALLRRALGANPDSDDLKDRLLELLEAHARWGTLDEELDARARNLSGPELAQLLTRQAENARDHMHDAARAAELFARADSVEPSFERARAAVELLIEAESFQDAASLARSALDTPGIKEDPRSVELALLRAEALESSGRVDAAIEALLETERTRPRSELVRQRLVELLARHGRWRDLAGVLDGMAAQRDPGQGLRLRIAAARMLLDSARDKEGALAMLQGAMKLAPAWLGDPDLAYAWAGADPERSPLVELAEIAVALGAPALAVDALRMRAQSLPVGPAQSEALVALAAAERDAGDLEAAEFTLKSAVEAMRDSPAAQRIDAEYALARLNLDRGRAADAQSIIARLLEAESPSAAQRGKALVLLAEALRALDRAPQALEALTEARALDPSLVSEVDIELALEAAGPSERSAAMLEKRAESALEAAEKARLYREASRTWEKLGRSVRALEPRFRAHLFEPLGRAEAQQIQDRLNEAERWGDLVLHLERRLETEDLTDAERTAMIVARARTLTSKLGRGVEAIEELTEAKEAMPKAGEILAALAEVTSALDLHDIHHDALARLLALSGTPEAQSRLLFDRALLLEKMGDLAAAAQCLEESVDLSLEVGKPARPIVERLSRIHQVRGDHAACARLWVRVAAAATGPEAAACLSRAGYIRLEMLDDRRGAMAALEAAARESELDLGLRRALLDLASALGDLGRARAHALKAAQAAKEIGLADAEAAFLRAERRFAEAMSKNGHDPLPRFGSVRSAPAQPGEEKYRASRSILDRTGRWAELAELEEQRARTLTDPLEKSAALVEVGRLHLEQKDKEPAKIEHARSAFLRALEVDPENVEALSRLARIEVEAGAWERAAFAFDALERLGGPPWPAPQFETLGARVAQALGQTEVQVARLIRAKARDPASLEALSELAHLSQSTERGNSAWLYAYEQALEGHADPAELARVGELRARSLLAAGKRVEALAEAERTIELDADSAGARELRRALLDESGPTRQRVDALIEESQRAGADEGVQLLLSALDCAEAVGDPARARDVALRIEETAHDLSLVFDRLKKFWLGPPADGTALHRMAERAGGMESLGTLAFEEIVAVARAALSADRAREAGLLLISLVPPLFDAESAEKGELDVFATALDRALGGSGANGRTTPRSLLVPRTMAELQSFVAKLAADPLGDATLISLLEALHALLPGEAWIVRRLAAGYERTESNRSRAASLYRSLAVSDPFDHELLAALERAVLGSADPGAVEGPQSILAVLRDGDRISPPSHPPSPIFERPERPLIEAHLFHPEIRGDLGDLLSLSAEAIASVLPPDPSALEEQTPAAQDPRVADLAEDVLRILERPCLVMIDRQGGFEVGIRAGEPPRIVVGESLVADATPAELRFHLARAGMLVELGYLIAVETAGPKRRSMLDVLFAACDPDREARIPADLQVAVDHIRRKLGPSGLAEAEPRASRLRGTAIELGPWMYGAVRTANRFGLLAGGDLEAALRALRRNDPEVFVDRPAARAETLARSPMATDLVRFLVSEDYILLARRGRRAASPFDRFASM